MSNWERKTHVQAAFSSSSSSKKYSMFVGRWQPWHHGHRALIDQQLERDKNILLCVRDVEIDDKNPFSTEWVVENLKNELKDLIDEGRLVIQVIPDIDSINIGSRMPFFYNFNVLNPRNNELICQFFTIFFWYWKIAVAGIGFTVSLLMNQLAFADDPALQDQGVLGVLAGSAVSIVIGGVLVAWRARLARRSR